MALRDGDKANFETLVSAAKNGDLALVQCADARTGEYRAVLAAVYTKDGMVNIVPLGHLCTGNPYEEYLDPEQSRDREKGEVS